MAWTPKSPNTNPKDPTLVEDLNLNVDYFVGMSYSYK